VTVPFRVTWEDCSEIFATFRLIIVISLYLVSIQLFSILSIFFFPALPDPTEKKVSQERFRQVCAGVRHRSARLGKLPRGQATGDKCVAALAGLLVRHFDKDTREQPVARR
jgi:hypothetical protein